MRNIGDRVTKIEKSGVGRLSDATRPAKEKWQLTRPKDMDPAMFTVKKQEWMKWKEKTEDYGVAIHPRMN